jgi:hypothetical protein
VRLIWATRGRSWGFRFLDLGGFDDPLRVYEEMYLGLEDQPDVFRRHAGRVAIRFPDPEGRTDAAGRVIPHDFVVLGPRRVISRIDSVDAGRREIWPIVSDAYGKVWLLPSPDADGSG